MYTDPQWISVDLGSVRTITRVRLNWEAAYAKAYQIQTSPDANTWTTVYSTTTGDGGIDDINLSGSGRYVRVNGTQRALTQYGYSLWELETGAPTPTPTSRMVGTESGAHPARRFAVRPEISPRWSAASVPTGTSWAHRPMHHDRSGVTADINGLPR
jgi:hypothetical protein